MTTLISNKFAHTNYEALETYRAGIVLHGYEVKSIKQGHGSLKESYIIQEDGELFLVKAHIPAYQPANTSPTYDPYRKRKILLSRPEIRTLIAQKQTSGLSLIPVRMYTHQNLVKIEIILARGKNKHDKRNDIKKRDLERDLGYRLKN